ncbi:MAG: glycosyltransferase, partial [Chloroflexota bacterium]|nr:glycosyltransferase [Chloroflexota bacterium]
MAIPNWNGARLLRPCLQSLRRQTFQSFDVLVVDNGSRDESLAVLSAEFPDVRVVSWPANRGFAAAVNEGVRQAAGEMVALLNNDMELDARWLEALVAALCGEPAAAACASKILFMDRCTINAVGDCYHPDGTPGHRGDREIDRGQYDQPAFIFGPSAGAALYRRALFEE